jgi:hypothetical protein
MGMTALTTLVEPLKRELAVPGVFDDAFPDTTDSDLAASLADGFSEAQLFGYFTDMSLGLAPDFETSKELSAAGGALVLLFTSMRIIRAQMRALTTSERYKAGPTEFEIQRSANLLRDELKYLQTRLDSLIVTAQRAARGARSASVIDGYWARQTAMFGGFYSHEYKG